MGRRNKLLVIALLLSMLSGFVSASFLAERIVALEKELNAYKNTIDRAKLELKRLDYQYLEELITNFNNDLEKARQIIAIDEEADEAYVVVANITNFLKESQIHLHESLPVETRAMWMDNFTIDTFYSRDDVARHMDELKSINVNLIFPDVYGNGAAIYPSKIVPQHDRFKSLFKDEDVLEIIIDEAHKRDIEVHPLVRVFGLHNGVAYFLDSHIHWLDKTKENRYTLDNGYYWLSPVHPEVREYNMAFLKELTANYDIDGIHLDYIRFDADFGYNDYTRDLYKSFYGVDPFDIKSPELNEHFQIFKLQFVNKFAERAFYELKAIKPHLLVSSAVASPYSWGRKDLGQDWLSWSQNRIVNFLTPMSYRTTVEQYASTVRSEITTINGTTYIFTGLGVYLYDQYTLIDQIEAGRNESMSGQAVFSTANMKHNDYFVLGNGPWREPATPTFRDPQSAAVMIASDVSKRLQEFQSNFENHKTIEEYSEIFAELSVRIDNLQLRPWDTRNPREEDPYETEQLEPLIAEIKMLISKINQDANRNKLIPLATANRLLADLGWIDSLLKPLLFTSKPFEYVSSR